jgi:uncharacterized protein YjiS (DUF1127 family)
MRMIGFLTAFAAHWQGARVRRVATRELAAMSVRELSDMGITRLDVCRLFEPRLVPEFRSRGGAGRIAAAATFKPLPQGPAFRISLETLI